MCQISLKTITFKINMPRMLIKTAFLEKFGKIVNY